MNAQTEGAGRLVMAQFTRWLRHNYDAVITLVVAAVALVLRLLGLLGDSQGVRLRCRESCRARVLMRREGKG